MEFCLHPGRMMNVCADFYLCTVLNVYSQTFESLVLNQWVMCFICCRALKITVDSTGIELLEEGFCVASLHLIKNRMRVFFSQKTR